MYFNKYIMLIIMKKRLIRTCFILLMTFVIFTGPVLINAGYANAATYITVQDFAKYMARKLKLLPIEGIYDSGYVNILLKEGIIKRGDFSSYKGYITRADAGVLLNRADEWLYGDTVKSDMVDLVIDKRISDINKIKASKRKDIAKCYIKGFIKGYNNGEYSTNREFKGSKKITKDGAINCINMLKSKSKRAKISPDGQMTRTSKLPVYADKYPYILATYPNEYYDWKFYYEGITRTINDVVVPYINIIDYATPIDVDKTTVYEDFPAVKKEHLNTWVNNVQTHLECVFNVDYRTIDDEWIEKVISTDHSYGYWPEEQIRDELEQYIIDMKKNKTIVECDRVAVDGSTLYFFNRSYYLRTHVHYRIVSSKVKYGVDVDTLIRERPYNRILWAYNIVDFTEYELGEWKESYFDVCISSYDGPEKENMRVAGALLDEYYYSERRTDK